MACSTKAHSFATICSFVIFSGAVATPASATDHLVEVNGHRVHVRVIEPKRPNPALPTVVFESGLGNSGGIWDALLSILNIDASIITYDRPGLGTSEPDPEPPTPRRMSALLHEALAKVGTRPPYVLVGHSWGGARIRMFASMYPTEVAGLLFVDPTDFTTTREDDLRAVWLALGLGAKERDELDQFGQEGMKLAPQPVQAEAQTVVDARGSDFQEFRSLSPLPDVPVVLLIAGRAPAPPTNAHFSFDAPRWFQQSLKARIDSLNRFASTLAEATVVITPNSTHYIQTNEPTLVAWAIQRLTYPSVLRRLERAYAAGGGEQLKRELSSIRATYPSEQLSEQAINSVGNGFLEKNQGAAALLVFQLNADDHPASSDAYNSLAGAYAAQGNKDLAIKNYQRSLEINPRDERAQRMLDMLSK